MSAALIKLLKRLARNLYRPILTGPHFDAPSTRARKRAEIIAVHRHGARGRKLLKQLKQVRETTEQLALLLDAKDDASDLIQELCGEWPKAMASRLIVDVEALERVHERS